MHSTIETAGGALIERESRPASYEEGVGGIVRRLDARRGVVLASGFEYPGRYTRLDIGFSDPPIEIASRERAFRITALNARGEIILPALVAALDGLDALENLDAGAREIRGRVRAPAGYLPEEQRSRQPSVFSVLRAILAAFSTRDDQHLGLYGAFAYDLAFQFEAIRLALTRPDDQRDLVLFLPDRIVSVDHARREAVLHDYEFAFAGKSTRSLPRDTPDAPARAAARPVERAGDHGPGEYAAAVEKARAAFARGDLFEAVLSQTFVEPCEAAPSVLFERLRKANPSPYGALMNLGEGEFLIAASPEMYVRVEESRVETCPISGTIARGDDPLQDAERIRTLLNSEKDAAELTMCTDVDRNDKSRICVPGSVRVIGRRQLEMYSRLIHTVDHVEGQLLPGYDALDAFLTHMWAVTVTGAPKLWAMQFVEDNEKSARRWYGGAIGRATFDGGMNTGLTLRTIRLKDGAAEVRAGATLLFDSDPQAEDEECRLKASALFSAIREKQEPRAAQNAPRPQPGAGKRVLMVDHQDSFVHTLNSYFRWLGCAVETLRPEAARAALAEGREVDLVLLSPGPGRPADFDLCETLRLIDARGLPVFGVCLGLQGMVEYGGGTLRVLPYPMHGKPSEIRNLGGRLLNGLPARFTVARYHSLHAREEDVPAGFAVTSLADDGVVMAIEHEMKPWAAVQFHPESILTAPAEIGQPLIANALTALCGTR
ncbi:anthranilate synthase component I [Amphiplicatus metriothermophilus]|uniref:Anthranilate synthase n=1 Tax=Amphiplicatus metriothermophilus TaxID=1519374 RepID=A0A239PVP8_9PROT|nr:anthranilate synthase component I [Amphiplicatus metriothermophilus]MBB5519677.1 anthranilate synthase [Amphiplicatus metriothermophilus]SNT74240.1 anthranilate synthase, component I [Amphiplicatus metriothermophilus]